MSETFGTEHPLVRALAASYIGDGATVYMPASASETAVRAALEPANRLANEEYFNSADRFAGDRTASIQIIHEQPKHRLMIYLHVAGATYQEIASQFDMTPSYIGQVLKQSWARARIADLVKELGGEHIERFLKKQVMPSLLSLVQIRDDVSAKATEKIAADKEILDRALGKSTVRVESQSNVNITKISEDAAELDRQLASLREQLKTAGQGGN